MENMNIETYIDWFLKRNFNVKICSIYQTHEGLHGIEIQPTIANSISFKDEEDRFFIGNGLLECLEKAKSFIDDKYGEINVEGCTKDRLYVQENLKKI